MDRPLTGCSSVPRLPGVFLSVFLGLFLDVLLGVFLNFLLGLSAFGVLVGFLGFRGGLGMLGSGRTGKRGKSRSRHQKSGGKNDGASSERHRSLPSLRQPQIPTVKSFGG